jgi:hypothetical protein
LTDSRLIPSGHYIPRFPGFGWFGPTFVPPGGCKRMRLTHGAFESMV